MTIWSTLQQQEVMVEPEESEPSLEVKYYGWTRIVRRNGFYLQMDSL